MQELENLQNKVNKLVEAYNNLSVENMRLNKLLRANETTIHSQKETLKGLEKKLNEKLIANHLTDDESKKDELKKLLADVIQQIDKNIELLKQ